MTFKTKTYTKLKCFEQVAVGVLWVFSVLSSSVSFNQKWTIKRLIFQKIRETKVSGICLDKESPICQING